MSIDATVEELVKGLKDYNVGIDLIRDTLRCQNHLSKQPGSPKSKKEDLLAVFSDVVIRNGIFLLLKKLEDTSSLKTFATLLEIDQAKVETLEEGIMKKGVNQFLGFCDKSQLTLISTALELGYETEVKMRELIADEVVLIGVKFTLDNCREADQALFKRWRTSFEIKEDSKDPTDDILCLIFDLEALESYMKTQEKEKAPKKAGKKKEPKKEPAKQAKNEKDKIQHTPISELKKDMTPQEVNDKFWVDDLRHFCQDKGLGGTGKKRVLINRILAYLNNGPPQKISKKRKGKGKLPLGKKTKVAADTGSSES